MRSPSPPRKMPRQSDQEADLKKSRGQLLSFNDVDGTRLFRCIGLAWIAAVLLTLGSFPAQAAPGPSDQVVDEAIVRALRYLAFQQRNSGGWTLQGTQEATSATSLAVMAFLAAGHTPGEGPYGEAINRGIQFVIDHQDASGLLYVSRGHQGPMYDHGISTLMLAEVSGMVPERMAAPTRKALERAVRLILASQMVPKPLAQRGGWRYLPQSTDSDLSVTGWQLLALRAAKDIGCDIPEIGRAVQQECRDRSRMPSSA
eukprot:TRINITY_DN1973_c0_g1_i4.p1 TRINITY_DN1973_c0_g1~~TRINITY_DN1973_c0_g1_i4.p1  ORF type:complete len:258 (-),score=42.66 TRINITY_DN1973_c0_g1_i4:23-796(-)